MIITLIGADFSKSNIGTLSSWIISRVLGDGATYAGPSYVDKDAAFNATVTLDEGYEIGSAGISITMGGTALDSSAYTVNGNVITFTIASVTGSIVIKVPTLNTNTGEEDGGGDNGGSQNPDTPDVPEAQHPYASGATMPANGVVTQDMFVELENTWLQSSGSYLDQKLDPDATGNTIGYSSAYLPIVITGYTKMDITAQADYAAYYQFFTKDGSFVTSGGRQKVDKGASAIVDIPSNAKYLVVAYSRSNLGTNKNEYGLYFPANIKIY